MTSRSLTAALVLLASLAPACSSTSKSLAQEESCTPGATQACLAPGGCDGVQVCDSDGSGYLPCSCGGAGGSSGSAGASSTGGAGAAGGGGSGAGAGAASGAGGAGGSPGGSGTGAAAGTGAASGTGGTAGGGGSGIPGQSCAGLAAACHGESCCTNILVPGGPFPMGRSATGTDSFSGGGSNELDEHDATVSAFYLDKYEVTVGRFRNFMTGYDGSAPANGAGAHPQIPGTGWRAAWDGSLLDKTDLSNWLTCQSQPTWTPNPGGNEAKAQNCVDWFEAMAFCIWDGGRLPTEAEWEYAAAGGDQNQRYPWGAGDPTCSLANHDACPNPDSVHDVGDSTGSGRWGHVDLAGNVAEWTFDWYAFDWYAGAGDPCSNCANTTEASKRVTRGGHFGDTPSGLRAARRDQGYTPDLHQDSVGFRCARSAP